jgi:hypothetical protein
MPTHKSGEESKQDPIRFKNLINEAAGRLEEKGMKEAEVSAFLKQAKELLDQPIFWSHTDNGLAVFIGEDGFEYFRLPYDLDSMVYVNDHFLITPLLPMMSLDGTFCVLSVSRQNAKLLRCTRSEVEDITPQNVSTSVEDYLEVEPEKQLQFHSGVKGQSAMFYGHNANEEDKMIVVEQFMREFEKGVTPIMNERNDPMVLVGLKENISLYKKVNNYRRVLEDAVLYNPDELQESELRDKGWDIIKKHFLKDMYRSLDQFSEKVQERVSNNLSEIAESTVMGRTDTIFISKGEKKWGIYDEENHTVQYSSTPGSDDVELLNWLSINGFKNGSKVYILSKDEMPMHSMVAAQYRF